MFPLQALDPSEAMSAAEARAVEDVIRCRCALVVCCQRLVAEVVSDWQHTMPPEHQLQLLGVLKVRWWAALHGLGGCWVFSCRRGGRCFPATWLLTWLLTLAGSPYIYCPHTSTAHTPPLHRCLQHCSQHWIQHRTRLTVLWRSTATCSAAAPSLGFWRPTEEQGGGLCRGSPQHCPGRPAEGPPSVCVCVCVRACVSVWMDGCVLLHAYWCA